MILCGRVLYTNLPEIDRAQNVHRKRVRLYLLTVFGSLMCALRAIYIISRVYLNLFLDILNIFFIIDYNK